MTTLLIDCTLPLRWRDLDAYQHVNNSVFLTLLEEARIQWFDSMDSPWRSQVAEPVMAAVQLNFRRPILYPGNVRVRLSCERVGRSSLTIAHQITAAQDDSVLHADGHTVIVWVSPEDGRSTALPDTVLRAVAAKPTLAG